MSKTETLKVFRVKDATNQKYPFAALIISYGHTPTGEITREKAIHDAARSLFPSDWLHLDYQAQEIYAGTPDADNYEPIAVWEIKETLGETS